MRTKLRLSSAFPRYVVVWEIRTLNSY